MTTIRTIRQQLARGLAAFFGAALIAIAAHAQTFNAEVRITAINGPSVYPNVAAGGTNVYIVWSEYANAPTHNVGNIYFSRSTNGGTSFTTPVPLSSSPSRSDVAPIIATNSTGTKIYVFWHNDTSTSDVFFRRSLDGGVSWGGEQQLTVTDGFYSTPTGALVDSQGCIHLGWTDARVVGYGQAYHRASCDDGSTWSAETNVTQFDGVVDNEAPRMVEINRQIFMLIRTSRNGIPIGGWAPFDHYLIRSAVLPNSPTNAVTWLRPAQKVSRGFPDEIANTYAGNMAVGAGGVLHLGFWSEKAGNNLVYRRGYPNGKGFEAPIDLSGFGQNHLEWDGATLFGIAEDGAGKVHAIYSKNNNAVGPYQTGPLYYRCSDNGGSSFVGSTLATGQADLSMPRAAYANNKMHFVWMDFRNIGNFGSEIYYRSVTTGACSAAAVQLSQSTSALSFGGQSMQTTAPGQAVTIQNTGSGTLTFGSITASAHFGQTNNCGASLAAGASCTITATFTPTAEGNLAGAITINSNANGSPHTVNLAGVGEKSLVTHYYRSILRRDPDAGGKAYWESVPGSMAALGANINETWYAMSASFFFSPEYIAFNRDDVGFVTDLYNTFFNRAPDGGGLAYWTGQIAQGMPREVVLVGFMFSPEFSGFLQGIFGNTAVRKEIDTVMDFYRGLLSRLPDTLGFNTWVGQFRTAQCSGAPAVYSQVESISRAFATSGEYIGRNRTNGQYVGDLYNAFLRRGGDLVGVQYWIDEISSGRRTREAVRQQFIASGEFTTVVLAIIAAGCQP